MPRHTKEMAKEDELMETSEGKSMSDKCVPALKNKLMLESL